MKRSEQKARTKYNIRQAFIDLLQRKEMDNITITELAKSANIDRKTFYLHYDTTFDVYHDIIDDVSNQLDDILKQQNDFDFFIFFNELNQVMQANFKFYQTIAKQKFLRLSHQRFYRYFRKWFNPLLPFFIIKQHQIKSKSDTFQMASWCLYQLAGTAK